MTVLYIDGTAVDLSAEFNIAIKHENPFFTKNGEYTYDIELSLNSPVNVKLYGFLNRLTKADKIRTDRRAVLIADNRTYIDGTEIITGWSDTAVQIQLVSGNSELNYFVGSDKMISELDLPETNPYATGSISKNFITSTYPDVEYNLAPVIDKSDSNKMKNKWLFTGSVNPDTGDFNTDVEPAPDLGDYGFIPQPYLCAFIRHILSALGYTLTYNAIEQTPWRHVYIAHVQPTYKWNEMLRGWTVKDFLEGVEKLFNGSFVIDYKKKTTAFRLNSDYIPQMKMCHVRNVDDVYSVECEEPEADAISSNITYNLPSTDYYKLRRLSQIVKDTAGSKTLTDTIAVEFNKDENKVQDTVFNCTAYNRSAIYHGHDIVPLVEFVDEFSDLVRSDADDAETYEIPFPPVEMTATKEVFDADPEQSMMTHYIPAADRSGSAVEYETYDTVTDMAKNLTEQTESKTNVYLALYSGMRSVGAVYYPFPYTDKYIRTSGFPVMISPEGASLCLRDMEPYFFADSYEIDRRNPVRFSSYDANLFDPTSVFEINNKRYLCKEIEYNIGPNGRDGAWSGLFYPARISDTSTDNRWILADGKWRDAGVWLDNGRWLDS